MLGGPGSDSPPDYESDRAEAVLDVLTAYAEQGLAEVFPPTCMEDPVCVVCTDLLRVMID